MKITFGCGYCHIIKAIGEQMNEKLDFRQKQKIRDSQMERSIRIRKSLILQITDIRSTNLFFAGAMYFCVDGQDDNSTFSCSLWS